MDMGALAVTATDAALLVVVDSLADAASRVGAVSRADADLRPDMAVATARFHASFSTRPSCKNYRTAFSLASFYQ